MVFPEQSKWPCTYWIPKTICQRGEKKPWRAKAQALISRPSREPEVQAAGLRGDISPQDCPDSGKGQVKQRSLKLWENNGPLLMSSRVKTIVNHKEIEERAKMFRFPPPEDHHSEAFWFIKKKKKVLDAATDLVRGRWTSPGSGGWWGRRSG